jgi:hypothetical protein
VLERFQAKWIPVRVKKTRPNEKIEPRSDLIGAEKALDRIKINAGELIEKVGLGSPKQMRDDELVPLICPTCQMLSRDRQSHPMPATAWLLCMGLFSIFLVERAAGLRRPKAVYTEPCYENR